ncbi:HPr family phosphocarrier protein [Shouchella lonarensis]|nr:HPr family phosphocarrier protein [Shouchella lonarensis]
MIEKKVTIGLKTGLQARPAAVFVQQANRFVADISLVKGTTTVDAKSIMGLMSLALHQGTTVTLAATGTDAEEAVATLSEYVEGGEV